MQMNYHYQELFKTATEQCYHTGTLLISWARDWWSIYDEKKDKHYVWVSYKCVMTLIIQQLDKS